MAYLQWIHQSYENQPRISRLQLTDKEVEQPPKVFSELTEQEGLKITTSEFPTKMLIQALPLQVMRCDRTMPQGSMAAGIKEVFSPGGMVHQMNDLNESDFTESL